MGNPVEAMMGSGFGEFGNEPIPVASPVADQSSCWIAPAFMRIFPRTFDAQEHVLMAMDYIRGSYRGSMDEAYLKLTVVMEGLALEVLRTRGVERGLVRLNGAAFVVVNDSEAWKELVASLRSSSEYKAWEALLESKAPEIEKLALTRHDGGTWVGSLNDGLAPRSTGELAASKRVETAFAAFDLKLDEKMKREAKTWHTARHTAFASQPGEDPLWARVAVLRSMLTALLFKWCDYSGPVTGYTWTEKGLTLLDPSWLGDWSTTEDAQHAATRFRMRTTIPWTRPER